MLKSRAVLTVTSMVAASAVSVGERRMKRAREGHGTKVSIAPDTRAKRPHSLVTGNSM